MVLTTCHQSQKQELDQSRHRIHVLADLGTLEEVFAAKAGTQDEMPLKQSFGFFENLLETCAKPNGCFGCFEDDDDDDDGRGPGVAVEGRGRRPSGAQADRRGVMREEYPRQPPGVRFVVARVRSSLGGVQVVVGTKGFSCFS